MVSCIGKFLVLFFVLVWPLVGHGLSFKLPKSDNILVGEAQVTQVKSGEDFSDVAMRFDVGYYEILEANPGIDPDHPPLNTVLIIPTQYILPSELKTNTIVINLAEMRLYYQPKSENRVYIFPVGIGKEDWETPIGERVVVRKVKNPRWVVPESIYKFRKDIGDKVEKVMPPGPDNPMGKYALFLSGAGYLRIHGTNLPASIGRRTSASCIRLYEYDIEDLYHLVDVGTKVVIINKPYKAALIGKKLYLEAHKPLFEQRIEMGDEYLKPALDIISAAIKGRNITVDWRKVNTIVKEHLTVPREI